MSKIVIITDSNSGIKSLEAQKLGIKVIPMPFFLKDKTYFEDILLSQKEFYEMLEKKQSLKQAHERAKRRVRNYANLSAEDIVNLAHEEFIENSVQAIQAKLEKIFNKEEKIELHELVSIGMSKVTAFIALLFLTAEGKCDLEQDEFYSDLYVVKA